MPIAMSNVLRIPIAIITSEAHTPLINICPQESIACCIPIFLAYTSLGGGHYDAAVTRDEPAHELNKHNFVNFVAFLESSVSQK
jgi:hypothetical protein